MKHPCPWILVVVAASAPACHCERVIAEDTDTEDTTSTSTASDTPTVPSSEESTGAPFDATRWIGRYHYEDALLDLGERGKPLGSHMLANVEIFADSTATLFYDECAFDEPITIAYTWSPAGEPGWLELHPGAGESSLRLLAASNLDTLRIQLVEPCRELRFEVDGDISEWLPFYLGESCWADRCKSGNNMMQVDYCPGEEPPPCP